MENIRPLQEASNEYLQPMFYSKISKISPHKNKPYLFFYFRCAKFLTFTILCCDNQGPVVRINDIVN